MSWKQRPSSRSCGILALVAEGEGPLTYAFGIAALSLLCVMAEKAESSQSQQRQEEMKH